MKSVSVKGKLLVPRKNATLKIIQESAAHTEHIRKNGVASVELCLVYLLAGDCCLTDTFVSCSSRVYQGFCNITLNRPLISEELKAELNPLVITVLSASSLPSSPVPLHVLEVIPNPLVITVLSASSLPSSPVPLHVLEVIPNPLVITVLSASSLPSSPVPLHVLEEKCLPVYCQYWFHNMPMHRTKGQKHSANVYFQDVNVIMTGLLSPGELMDFLQGPPVEIEVHDRDSKLEKALTTPALFGTEPNDDKLSSVVLVSGKQTNQNPFRERTKRYNPYGIAKLNLSDLLHGQCSLKVNLPIRGPQPPQQLDSERSNWKRKMAALPGTGVVDGQKEPAMPMGHYFDANSQLKVHVEIACPLKVGCDDGKTGCPFGRIIYLFKYTNISAMSLLRSELLRINALAFQLEDQSEETVERALSCYKMAVMERESRDLDVVTGFHLLDKQIHLFVLEGLKHKAIRRLWEAVPIKLTGSEEDQVIVLYNSSLSFYNRLYDLLDISFTPIHLHKPLETIMRQPLVYIRDMVPYPCFQAMSRLSLLVQLRMLKDVVQNNLFPSAEMILSMNKEFGVLDLGKWRQGLEGSRVVEAGVPSYHGPENPSCCLDTHNHLWRQHMHTKQLNKFTKDFIQANIAEVQGLARTGGLRVPLEEARTGGLRVPLEEVRTGRLRVPVEEARTGGLRVPVEEARTGGLRVPVEDTRTGRLRVPVEEARSGRLRVPLKDPRIGGLRVPVKEARTGRLRVPVKDARTGGLRARSRASWRTDDGFICPGFRSSIEANEHPRQPDEARREELRKPWKENILHGNLLRPTLPERDRLPWLHRYGDMELYVKPPAFFSPVPPVTIHLAGERLQKEQRQAAQRQYYRWLRKVLPDTRRSPVPTSSCSQRRVPQFSCHMGGADPGKLQEMLKDPPMKYSLRKPGLTLKPIPVLSVVQRPQQVSGSGCVEREDGLAFTPGPYQKHSLSCDNNFIPRHTSLYNKYHFVEFQRERSFEYKRSALPLTDMERCVHVFQQPPAAYYRQTVGSSQSHAARSIVETRTHRDVTLHVN
ncbi:uncharacterized protein cfap92 [Esox lucius]|uniref:uncharacterized protein cfap92 n=1 Tax=Esox lucius TaxID=8010 RepID=UPI001476CEA4|nr:uncharacterized protein cfap92 [Esox lucius]